MQRRTRSAAYSVLAALLCAFVVTPTVAANPNARARQILKATNVQGGLVVHVGCGDGKLTAALRASDSYLVHGLDTDTANVLAARKHVAGLGIYGSVSAARFDGKRLPYIDNTVNLVVAGDLGDVPMPEVMRVLCPNGVAYVQAGGKWTRTVKPRPAEIDEWTHYMHDAGGNAVAHDTVVGPPRRLQWQGSPRWARHHDHMSSVSACVTSGGRVFYIFDEAPRASILTPPSWKLIARDAFNGTILWKRDIRQWYPHLLRLKSGPAVLPRRLVAVGDRVYVTLGIDASLTALDAATGDTVRTYKDTAETQEVLLDDGVLFVVADIPGQAPPTVAPDAGRRRGTPLKTIWHLAERRIAAFEPNSGKLLWRTRSTIMPMTAAADAKGLYFHDGETVVCLDRATGKPKWQSEPIARTKQFLSFFGATLLVHDGIVLFAGGETAGGQSGSWYTKGTDTLTALSAATGKKLWDAYHPPSGYRSPEDVLVINGVVWSGETTSGKVVGEFTGRDIKTGKVIKKFNPDVNTYWFHHRCYRGKATDKFLIMSRAGTELIDPKTGHWEINHWIRGACLYGIMPANGLLYNPPHPCACYPEAKQNGFSVVAPAAPKASMPQVAPAAERLERGPAFGTVDPQSAIHNPQSSWPTYRGDAARSGSTGASVPVKLKQAWKTKLGGLLSAVTVAEGKLFVATIADHTVHALNAATGEPAWSYTAGGRVDSPPTIHKGRAIFGCADGYVYCLRATDGVLAWRFRAAPDDRRLVVFEQVESVWPVSGSVLVRDGAVHCVAGRSMFLDGGLRMVKLDAATGRLLVEKVLDDRDDAGKKLQSHIATLSMPVALPDILSCDGKYVYMRSQRFDLAGNRQDIAPRAASEQLGEGAHLFSPTGFLDGDYWHRTYWVFGRTFPGGYSGYYQAGRVAPSGKMMVFDDDSVYGFGRKAKYFRWTTPIEHQLFAEARGVPRADSDGRGGMATTSPWVSVDNSTSLDPTGKPLAVEAWVNAATDNGVVLARGGPSQGYALLLNGGTPTFLVRSGKTLAKVSTKQKVSGRWVHLAGVLTEDKQLKLFIDGKSVATTGGAEFISGEPAQAMEIGADAGSAVAEYPSPYTLNALIDDVRVYHGVVADAEIAAHAAAAGKTASKTAKLVLHLTFDENAKDASGCRNHGRLLRGARLVKGRDGQAAKVGRRKRSVGRKGQPKPATTGRRWCQDLPILVRGMVLADKTLFVAGLPDFVDEDAAAANRDDKAIHAKLAEQVAAWAGKRGASLWVVQASDGARLAEYKLGSPPVWDGVSAATGRLYIATMAGEIISLGGDE